MMLWSGLAVMVMGWRMRSKKRTREPKEEAAFGFALAMTVVRPGNGRFG
jgi:hypothetical protein